MRLQATRASVVAELDAVTGLATPWDPYMIGMVLSLLNNASTIYVAGSFGAVENYPRSFIAAFDR